MQTTFRDRSRDLNFNYSKSSTDFSEAESMVLGGMSGEGYTSNGHDNFELNSRQGSSGISAKKSMPANGKKTKGRVKIKMEFIDNKLRRYTTFSKRKTGIMKKAYELSTLTGTQVMLLVASETGHVYTFATRKLQPMITSEAGKALIQTCLNSPDLPPGGMSDQRMSATGFEETDLSYSVPEDCDKMVESPEPASYPSDLSPSSLLHHPSPFQAKSSPVTTSHQSPLNGSGFTTILTTAGTAKNQTSSESSSPPSSHNSISVVQNPSPNVSVVSGSVVLPQGAILQAAANQGVLYQMGQSLVYATPTNLPEGVRLNLQQEPGAQQQYITIPVSLSLSTAQQQQIAPVVNQASTLNHRKDRSRK